MWEDKINKDGIFLLDDYVLDYYGVLVFFEVCKTDTDRVAVYELAIKKKKIDGEFRWIITKKIRQNKNPVIIARAINTFRKSDYWVYPVDRDTLPIEVPYGCTLYNEAKRAGTDYPVFGTAYAKRVENIKKYYWDVKERSILA